MARALPSFAAGVLSIAIAAEGRGAEPDGSAESVAADEAREPRPDTDAAAVNDDAPAASAGTSQAGTGSVALSTRGVSKRAPRGASGTEDDDRTGSDASAKPARDRGTRPWIRRWRPERNMVELGIFGGMLFLHEDHDLYDPVTAPPEPIWAASPDVGLRLGYFPLRALGVEAEFSGVPTRMRTLTNDPLFVYGFRGHLIAQLPYYSVVPFFLVGGGLLGVKSHVLLLGDDVDPAFHYGGGLKVFVNRWLGFRLEARNIISAAQAKQDSGTFHAQVLAGLTITLGRKKHKPLPPEPPPEDPDRDKDGIPNVSDACPDQPGVEPHGCPDTDGDGFRDTVDKCPEVPGVEPDGCPVKDTDGDGIPDPTDACPFQPENFNGHEDEDGCPDELPPEVKEFTGTIPGIEFDFNKATIKPSSRPTLDRAIEILEEYPDIKVHIIGHTDDVGTPEFNQQLSEQRAEAVKKYLVDGGIDASRITTEGRGATDPQAPNDNEENRAKNRRIEFEVVERKRPDEAPPAEKEDGE